VLLCGSIGVREAAHGRELQYMSWNGWLGCMAQWGCRKIVDTASRPRFRSIAAYPADANRIVAFSLFGEVYVSEDAGASWRKIAREFGEIRAAVWVPN
jgi:hypothetical protein